MVNAGAVSDDDRGAVVGFRLIHGLQQLHGIGAHGNLGDVDIAVAHGHHAQIFLLGALAGCRELGDRAGGRGLGSLTAGIGVNFGIKHKDVDVLILGDHVIQTAEPDIVGPAVTAEDPDGFLDQHILVRQNFRTQRIGAVLLHHFNQPGTGCLGFISSIRGKPAFAGGDYIVVAAHLSLQGFQALSHLGAALVERQVHAEAELGVILKQAVCPGGAVPFIVDSIGDSGGGTAVDRAAAGSVRDDHSVTEQLGHQLDIGGFAAAGTGAGELKQGLQELAALDGVLVDLSFKLRELGGKLGVFTLLGNLLIKRLHDQGFFLGGANLRAVTAACAVKRTDLDTELEARVFFAQCLFSVKGGRLFGAFLYQIGADDGVGADQRALVALNAVIDLPLGHIDRNAALLVLSGGGGYAAVGGKGGNGQLVAFLRQNRTNIAIIVFGGFNMGSFSAGGSLRPALGHLDLFKPGDGDINGVPVLLNDGRTLAAIGMLGVFLHVAVGILVRDNLCQLEESSLHDGVDTGTHTNLSGEIDGIDVVETRLFDGQLLLHVGRQTIIHLFLRPGAVEQEDTAFFERIDHVVSCDVGGVVAGDKVCKVDLIGRLDGGFSKAQMRNGQAA